MTIDPRLVAIMGTVRLYAPAGTDAYGQTTYATSYTTVPGHVVQQYKELTSHTGETVVSAGHVHVGGVFSYLNDRYRIGVPDPTAPSGWRVSEIVAIVTRNDQFGPHHQTVYFGERGSGSANLAGRA